MNQALTVGLDFSAGNTAATDFTQAHGRPPGRTSRRSMAGRVPGASGALGRCILVYMDDCLVHSPKMEQHLLDVAEALEIFRRRQLCAKSSKCEFGRQELGFFGHRLSKAGVSVNSR